MRSSTILSGMIALAVSSASARVLPGQSLARRHAFGTTGTCALQPAGSGPVTSNPDTADAFVANSVYGDIANSAALPSGYSLQYQNLQAASTTGGYLGYEELTSYDTAYCASQCCSFWPGCESFNIYLERDPILDPGDNCTNPASTTRIKCSYWSEIVEQADTTNNGQWCSDFHIVIAGSNGYKANSCPSSSTTSTTATSTTSTSTTATTASSTTTTTSSSAITSSSSTTTQTSSTVSSTISSTTTTTKSTTTSCTTTNRAPSMTTTTSAAAQQWGPWLSSSSTTSTMKTSTTAVNKAAATTSAAASSAQQPQKHQVCFLFICWMSY